MKAKLLSLLVACGALGGLWASDPALAQKSGGVLRMPLGTSIASVSIHEESTIVVLGPMMGVFNNLVMFDQHVPQNTLSSIVSDLASSWSWSEDGKELTFKLRDGVKWHDGKPFTAADVKCTWDLITGKSTEKLRVNPRKSWYRNLEEVIPNGDNEVTFRLKRPQTSFIALLASGWSPVRLEDLRLRARKWARRADSTHSLSGEQRGARHRPAKPWCRTRCAISSRARGLRHEAPCAARSARTRRSTSAAVNRCQARSADLSSLDACSRYRIGAEAAQSRRGSGRCKGPATTDERCN